MIGTAVVQLGSAIVAEPGPEMVLGATFLTAVGQFAGGHGNEETADAVVFYELPTMIVNLGKGMKKQAYLKIRFSLELDETQDLKTLERLLPRVIDHFQVYLRELRVDDLHGSAGLYRLKEELLRRVSVAAHPVKIRDVLFKEMLIQ